jgi:Fe2+ or Zn2+ uptake regulation protein
MIAPSLFDAEQPAELARVTSKLAARILRFFGQRTAFEFHASELHDFVAQEFPGCAPASADRVMRDLRKAGLVRYVVVNRRQSLYRAF